MHAQYAQSSQQWLSEREASPRKGRSAGASRELAEWTSAPSWLGSAARSRRPEWCHEQSTSMQHRGSFVLYECATVHGGAAGGGGDGGGCDGCDGGGDCEPAGSRTLPSRRHFWHLSHCAQRALRHVSAW